MLWNVMEQEMESKSIDQSLILNDINCIIERFVSFLNFNSRFMQIIRV